VNHQRIVNGSAAWRQLRVVRFYALARANRRTVQGLRAKTALFACRRRYRPAPCPAGFVKLKHLANQDGKY